MSEMLTTEEVGAWLRLSNRTVFRLASSGGLPCFRIGGQWRFPKDEIEKYVQGQLHEPKPSKNDLAPVKRAVVR